MNATSIKYHRREDGFGPNDLRTFSSADQSPEDLEFWSPRRMRILIADDDQSVRRSLAQVLEQENYQVFLAHNGREAIRQFQQHLPDLVLLDLNMPGKDGWEALKAMDSTEPLTPVIVITARPNQLERAQGEGVDAIMEKPLDLPVLLDAMEGLLVQSSRERFRRVTDHGFQTQFLGSRKQASHD